MDHHVQQFVIAYANRAWCRRWVEVMDAARRAGQPVRVADAWIAATAFALASPLVPHNAADFQGVAGLMIVSETGP